MMTVKQKQMFRVLVAGGCVSSGCRILDGNKNVVIKVWPKIFRKYKHLLESDGSVYRIDEEKVMKLHGNSLIRRWYQELSEEFEILNLGVLPVNPRKRNS